MSSPSITATPKTRPKSTQPRIASTASLMRKAMMSWMACFFRRALAFFAEQPV